MVDFPFTNEIRRQILLAAERHGARNVRVFGSSVRGEACPTSDVDFLVELAPDRSLIDQAALADDLREVLSRDVDIVVEGGISPYLESRILAEAVPL